jgi:hypothetical protein
MVPLRGLQREFAIADDSSDGRMLNLIVESLDFVAGLQLGDRLPAEVLTGNASWDTKPQFRELAQARLRLHLVGWLNPDAAGSGAASDASALQRLDSDPELRRQVQLAFERAAQVLGLPQAEDVVPLLGELAEELAFIEALRATLLQRVQALGPRLAALDHGYRGDRNRIEMLTQVQRLMAIASKQLGTRFAEVDANTGEILSALRNAERQQTFIRAHRDWLHRCQRAWDPILDAWDAASTELNDGVWQLIGRTYQFLAPRYMQVQEWQAFNSLRGKRTERPATNVMFW